MTDGTDDLDLTADTRVIFWVKDLDAAVATLEARSVAVGDPHVVTEGLRAAEFEDPSGNALFVEGR